MAWYQRIYFELKNIIKNFIFILNLELTSLYRNYKKIRRRPYFLLLLPIFLFFVQIWLIIFLSIFFIFYLYFDFLFIYNFVFLKSKKYNIINPYKFNFKKITIKNKLLHHLYYFFFELPKIKAFEISYNTFKIIYLKKKLNNFFIFILIAFLILPFRFFIKMLTGFNYICIKISFNLLTNLVNIFDFEYENLNAILDNFFLDLYSTYLNPAINNINKYKIYYNTNKIVFNPFEEKIIKIFKDLPSLKKSLYFSNEFFQLRFIRTSKISGHPCFTSFANEKNFKELTVVIQSSKQYRPVLNNEKSIIKDLSDIKVEQGVLGKDVVYDHRPVTIDLVKESIKLKSIDDWNNIIDPDLQKKIALKTLYASFYKKDLVLENGQITESLEFNLYIERLFALYKNNELTQDAYDAMSYLLEFSEKNDIIHCSIKQSLWNYLMENIIFTDEGVIIPNFEMENLPLNLKNMISMFEEFN